MKINTITHISGVAVSVTTFTDVIAFLVSCRLYNKTSWWGRNLVEFENDCRYPC